MNPSSYSEDEVEDAMRYLFSKQPIREKSKPFALHSVRVASILWNGNAPQEAVVAAILHDLIEDTATTKEDLEQVFGERIAEIVDISSIDKGVDDYKLKLKNFSSSVDKARTFGVNALLVRAADLIDNSNYYKLADTKELEGYLVAKYTYFLDTTKTMLEDTFIWPLLVEAYERNVSQLADRATQSAKIPSTEV